MSLKRYAACSLAIAGTILLQTSCTQTTTPPSQSAAPPPRAAAASSSATPQPPDRVARVIDGADEDVITAAMIELAEGPDGTLTMKGSKSDVLLEKNGGRVKMTQVRSGKVLFEEPLAEFKEGMYRNALAACQKNLKNLAVSLEMYSTENAGAFPSSLSAVIPSQLKTMPRCPVTAKDTYSTGYQSSTSGTTPYTLMCTGGNHKASGLPENFPQYTAAQGLLNKPGEVASPAAAAPSAAPTSPADNDE